jgi:hypothetical protein
VLIILNGVETIHRKWFAEEIFKAMNTFTVENYTVKFVGNSYVVRNSTPRIVDATVVTLNEGGSTMSFEQIPVREGEVVFDTATNNNKLLSFKEGGLILNKIEDLFNSFEFHKQHFANVFVDLDHDFEFADEFEGELHLNETYCYPTGYDDLINNYKTRSVENYVISGGFSRATLTKIQEDLGESNVKIVNIIRNPCPCFIAHARPDSHFEDNPNYSEEYHHERLPKSIINAANLVQFRDVETIKFEDIAKNGKFSINGVEILFPPNHATMYNEWLTSYERQLMDEILPTLPEERVNEFISSYTERVALYQNFGSTKGVSWAPENIFEMLGYEPVDYETIIQPDAS